MKRKAIITVGKTHSGKTTFAKALEQELSNSIVVDQDNHATFINSHYKKLVPKQGSNTIKHAITKTVVDYAVEKTNYHLIICNSNRNHIGRLELIRYYKEQGFTTILVNFIIPEHVLRERIANSNRSTAIFRTASSFEEVLDRQGAESQAGTEPTEDEADYLFEIRNNDEAQSVIRRIVKIT